MRDQTREHRVLCAFVATVVFVLGLPAWSAELKMIAPNAVKEAVVEIAAGFEKETKHKVVLSWGGSESISKQIAEGAAFDVVINTSARIEQLTKDGKLAAGSKRDFSRSAVAVAVKAGASRPDVSTVEGIRQAVLKAESIAISSGASGRYLEQLFQRLGVAEQIKHKIKQPPSGAQISDLLRRGEAELGFQQVTELVHAKGIQYLGVLPAEIQNYTVWSAAVHAGAKESGAAAALVRVIAAPQSASIIRASGMDPIP